MSPFKPSFSNRLRTYFVFNAQTLGVADFPVGPAGRIPQSLTALALSVPDLKMDSLNLSAFH